MEEVVEGEEEEEEEQRSRGGGGGMWLYSGHDAVERR